MVVIPESAYQTCKAPVDFLRGRLENTDIVVKPSQEIRRSDKVLIPVQGSNDTKATIKRTVTKILTDANLGKVK